VPVTVSRMNVTERSNAATLAALLSTPARPGVGANARALSVPALARVVVARRLDCRQRALYRVYTEEGPGAAAQTSAARDGRASRTAAASDSAQRHLEHGFVADELADSRRLD
jgi:hypothetical protein